MGDDPFANNPSNWGEDFEQNFRDFEEFQRDFQAAESTYKLDPTPLNKAAMEAAEAKRDKSRLNSFKDVATSLKANGDFFADMDFSNSWEADKQPKLSDAQKLHMDDFVKKMTAKTVDVEKQIQLNKYMSDLSADVKGLKYDPKTGQIDFTDSWEKKTKDFWNKNISDKMTWDNFLRLIKLAIVAGVAYGGYELVKWFMGVLCDLAKADSGCYYYPAGGGDPSAVHYNGNAPSSKPNCSSYADCCGGCSDGSLQSICGGSPEVCCNASVDAQASAHTGGQYSFKCTSVGNEVANFFKSIGSAFNPANLVKYIEYIGMAIGLLLVAYLFYVVAKKVAEKGEE